MNFGFNTAYVPMPLGWDNPGNHLILFFELDKNVPGAKCPKPGNNMAAGIDIYSPITTTIPPKGKVLIDTGVKARPPAGYHLEINSRSGLSAKYGVEKGAGIIDRDYSDSIGVILYNHSDTPVNIVKHDRIAQFIIRKTEFMAIKQVDSINDGLNRGGGFGSTGK